MSCLLIFIHLFFTSQLTLEVKEIKELKGTLRIAVYDSEATHLDEETIAFYKEVPVTETGSMTIELDLPDGTYSIAIYHDLNNDKKLNTNLVGIPKEPYGFSNNVMGTFGPPSFEAARVMIPNSYSLSISLR
ncbi:MAG: DUF2141 domain-containing protein [Marinoscillum sp.]